MVATNSNLFDAFKLCRHYDEFFELSTLAADQFFLAPNWTERIGNHYKQQHLPLESFSLAHLYTVVMLFIHIPTFRVSLRTQNFETLFMINPVHGGGEGVPMPFFEVRNFLAACVKCNNLANRRLIQGLAMQTYRVLLVRDGNTGRISLY